MAQQEDEALTILTQSIQQDAGEQANDAAIKMIESSKTIQDNSTAEQASRVITNKTIDELYEGVTSGGKVVSYLPKGTKIISKTDDMRTEVDPKTGQIKVIMNAPEAP